MSKDYWATKLRNGERIRPLGGAVSCLAPIVLLVTPFVMVLTTPHPHPLKGVMILFAIFMIPVIYLYYIYFTTTIQFADTCFILNKSQLFFRHLQIDYASVEKIALTYPESPVIYYRPTPEAELRKVAIKNFFKDWQPGLTAAVLEELVSRCGLYQDRLANTWSKQTGRLPRYKSS